MKLMKRKNNDSPSVTETERKFRLNLMYRIEHSRKIFANHLHDNLLQNVQSAKNLVEHATIAETNVKKHLLSLHAAIIESIRDEMYTIYPSALEYLGLYEALHTLCQKAKKDALGQPDLTIRFDGDSNMEIAKSLHYPVYRMVSELLQNAVKHAQAKTITVIVQSSRMQIIIDVIDDGTGFHLKTTLEQQCHVSHIGILSVRQDAATLGGALSYQTWHPHGTHAQIKLPANTTYPYKES
jgi:signal transduction histidine kinase